MKFLCSHEVRSDGLRSIEQNGYWLLKSFVYGKTAEFSVTDPSPCCYRDRRQGHAAESESV